MNQSHSEYTFRVYELGLTTLANSMSQIADIILQWAISSVFQKVSQNLLSRHLSVVYLEHLSIYQIYDFCIFLGHICGLTVFSKESSTPAELDFLSVPLLFPLPTFPLMLAQIPILIRQPLHQHLHCALLQYPGILSSEGFSSAWDTGG